MAHKWLNWVMSAKATQTPYTLNCLMNASIDPYTKPKNKPNKPDFGSQWCKGAIKGPKDS